MPNLDRVRVSLTGFPGAPGVNTFYALAGIGLMPQLQALYTALAFVIPANVAIQVENTGDRIDAATGALVGSWNAPAVAPIQGLGAGVYSAPVGCLLRWETGVVNAGHRVRGRTFIVPAQAFGTDGSMNDVALVDIRAAAAVMANTANPNFVVWSRPFAGSPATVATPTAPARPAKPARSGAAFIVVSSTVPDKMVVLRSRRD